MTHTHTKHNIVGLRELREHMDKYVSRVEKGESFLVLRKSTPVFKLAPVDEWGDEGTWDRLDLRDAKGRGMDADKFLTILKKVIQKDEQNRKISRKTPKERKRSRFQSGRIYQKR